MTTQTCNPDYIEIPLSKQGKHAGKYVALVSSEDADLATLRWSILWSRNVARYAYRWPEVRLHRVILGRMLGRELLDIEQVDHINGDGLDNRRCNLRLASNQQNQFNRGKNKNNTSGYKGVTWDARQKKWAAFIVNNRRIIRIGFFITPEKAHEAYKQAAKQLHGEFANFGDAE